MFDSGLSQQSPEGTLRPVRYLDSQVEFVRILHMDKEDADCGPLLEVMCNG